MSTAGIYTNEDQTRLTEKQEEVVAAVATAVIHGTATLVDQVVDATQPVKKITRAHAQQLLQTILDNLEEGFTFELNDVRYVVADHKNVDETASETTPSDLE